LTRCRLLAPLARDYLVQGFYDRVGRSLVSLFYPKLSPAMADEDNREKPESAKRNRNLTRSAISCP
jgi:hypothetical protein